MKIILAGLLLWFSSHSLAGVFQTATEVIDSMDYLDRDHASTACFARATFVSLELRNKQIEAFNVFVFGEFFPLDTYFNYHVAAGFYDLEKSEEPFVVDPIFSQQPLTLKAWIELLKPKTTDVVVKLRPAGDFSDPEQVRRAPSREHPEKEVPRFEISQIAFACQTLHRLLAFHPQTSLDMQRKLVGRYVYHMDGRDPEKPIEFAPSISCIPQPLRIKKKIGSGAFVDAAWAPSGIKVIADVEPKNRVQLKFEFAAFNGRQIKVQTQAVDIVDGFEGYLPVYNDESAHVIAGFVSISIMSPTFIRGQLFGTPFVAEHLKPVPTN